MRPRALNAIARFERRAAESSHSLRLNLSLNKTLNSKPQTLNPKP